MSKIEPLNPTRQQLLDFARAIAEAENYQPIFDGQFTWEHYLLGLLTTQNIDLAHITKLMNQATTEAKAITPPKSCNPLAVSELDRLSAQAQVLGIELANVFLKIKSRGLSDEICLVLAQSCMQAIIESNSEGL